MTYGCRYGYYLAAAAGVKVPKGVKKSLTTVQLAQFALFFVHALYGAVYATHYRPRIIIVLCLFQAVVFASLFGNFFWCAAHLMITKSWEFDKILHVCMARDSSVFHEVSLDHSWSVTHITS